MINVDLVTKKLAFIGGLDSYVAAISARLGPHHDV